MSLGKKTTYISIIIIIFIIVLVINDKISDTKIYFQISDIRLGQKSLNVNEAEIFKVAEKYLKNKSFFNINLDYLKNSIEKVAWVKNAYIRRSYPNEVIIFIEEYTPVAVWNNDSYISENGYIFSANKIEKKLPKISSYSNRNIIIFEYFSLILDGIRKNKLNDKVLLIKENEIRSLTVLLESNIAIKFGSKNIKERIGIFFKAYKTLKTSDLKKIRYIDMRYSNGFSIGWK
tara:strand:- start:1582 stop:2277 length:696 start_codon:yes stop_codon:yes gene_type:complete